jgi:hypothetical protein
MSIVDGTSNVPDKRFTAKLHICQALMQLYLHKSVLVLQVTAEREKAENRKMCEARICTFGMVLTNTVS